MQKPSDSDGLQNCLPMQKTKVGEGNLYRFSSPYFLLLHYTVDLGT